MGCFAFAFNTVEPSLPFYIVPVILLQLFFSTFYSVVNLWFFFIYCVTFPPCYVIEEKAKLFLPLLVLIFGFLVPSVYLHLLPSYSQIPSMYLLRYVPTTTYFLLIPKTFQFTFAVVRLPL